MPLSEMLSLSNNTLHISNTYTHSWASDTEAQHWVQSSALFSSWLCVPCGSVNWACCLILHLPLTNSPLSLLHIWPLVWREERGRGELIMATQTRTHSGHFFVFTELRNEGVCGRSKQLRERESSNRERQSAKHMRVHEENNGGGKEIKTKSK